MLRLVCRTAGHRYLISQTQAGVQATAAIACIAPSFRCYCNHQQQAKQQKTTRSTGSSKSVKKSKYAETDKKPLKKPDPYMHTVCLPSSQLPLYENANLYEQTLVNSGLFDNLYKQQSEASRSERQHRFILLDGPPYANGDLHIGHAINKLLKDIYGRYQVKKGMRLHFRPGWDCHGLPIELKALKSSDDSFRLAPSDIRQQANQFAQATVQKQMKTMKRWAVLANFSQPYVTSDKNYVIQEIEAFYKLYETDLIFRRHLPIYWSPSSRTALAESELEYNETHAGHSVYLKFKLDHRKLLDCIAGSSADISLSSSSLDAYAIIWTTTPWTLPANQAIAYSEKMDYCLVRSFSAGPQYLVSLSSLKHLEVELGMKFELLCQFSGDKLKNLMYESPLRPGQMLPFLNSPFIAEGKGSGLVHTAPNHGYDDYLVFGNHQLQPDECLVDRNGCYNSKVSQFLPEPAIGLPVVNEGSDFVIKHLQPHILQYKPFVHSYPYDWRTKQPVITMATYQFFMNIDPIKEQCEQEIDRTTFYPESFKNKLKQNITERPQWCISRQRCWGVPIPVFYQAADIKQAHPIISRTLISRIVGLIQQHGPNAWWDLPVDAFLTPAVLQNEQLPGQPLDYVKGSDILDVWFDSGLAFNNVLKDEPNAKADLIIEGQDQLRGWFLSSLILGVALQKQAPYRTVVVHGFAVDKDFKKMSKSLGNVLDPDDVVSGLFNLGADVLRIWVAQYANRHLNVATGEEQFGRANETLQKIRKTLRYCISNLNDIQSSDLVAYDNLILTDKFMLHRLHQYGLAADAAYQDYDLRTMMDNSMQLLDFVSNFYFTSVKNTLYNDDATSLSRRSAQTLFYYIGEVLTQYLCPIAPLFCEHLAKYHPMHLQNADQQQSPSLSRFEISSSWYQPVLASSFEQLMILRDRLNANFNGDAALVKLHATIFTKNSDLRQFMSNLQHSARLSELSDFLQTSTVSVVNTLDELPSLNQSDASSKLICDLDEASETFILIQNSPFSKCKRCRKYLCHVNSFLCDRCLSLLSTHYPDLLKLQKSKSSI